MYTSFDCVVVWLELELEFNVLFLVTLFFGRAGTAIIVLRCSYWTEYIATHFDWWEYVAMHFGWLVLQFGEEHCLLYGGLD